MTNYLKFWGTRGSCPVSGPEYRVYGGNTCCLEISYENSHIILDAGTGIRSLGEDLLKRNIKEIHLLLGHTHWDHIIGFPFFDPFFKRGLKITIWSPAAVGRSCKEIFSDLFSLEFFPVSMEDIHADIEFRTLHPKTPVTFGPLTLDFHNTVHPPGNALCFKIETPHQKIGYVTDNEMLKGYHGSISNLSPHLFESYESLLHFLSNCSTLIHEAQYSPQEYIEKEGWGHSSIQNTAALFKKISIPEWFVTHHDPKHSDEELELLQKTARDLLKENHIPTKVEWVKEKREIRLK